jgi:hypothetical protein
VIRILAVRLKEVGRFRDGVAIDGFGPGLNVLAAANEAGKSTILRALSMLFRDSHLSLKQDIRRMQPDSGGAPQIECEFEIGGTQWCLRKQYLAGRSAELRQIGGGAVYRGADAEAKLEDMLSGAGGLGEAMDLLWVGQGQSFAPPKVSAEQRASFAELVQGEMDQVTGAGRLSQVLELVRKDLFGLVTEGRRQPRRGGRLVNAIEDRSAAEEAYQAAHDKAQRAEAREHRLVEINRREAELGDGAAVETRETALAQAQGRVEAAREARAKFDLASAKVASSEYALRSTQAALQAFETAQAELAAGAERRVCLEAQRSELADTLGASEERVASADELVRQLQVRRHDLQRAQVAAERAARRQEAKSRYAELSQRLHDVRAAEETIAGLREAYAALRIEQSDVDRIRSLEDELRHLRHRQSAAAATVRVRYDVAGDRRFRMAGTALENGQELEVIEATRIVADGVGEIEIAPGEARDGEDLGRRIDVTQAELASHLARLEVADQAAAAARLAERAELERQGQELAARIKGLAPEGREALEAQHTAIGAVLDGQDEPKEDDVPPCTATHARDEAERLTEVDRQLTAVQADRANAVKEVMAQREALARSASERDALNQRLETLAAQLPADGETRERAHGDLKAAFEAAQETLNTAVREFDAWRAAAPDDDALAGLETAAAEQARMVKQADRELAELRESRREIEGSLGRDVEDGVAADATAKHERLQRLIAREEDIQREKAALTVLERELAEVLSAQRAQLAAPLVQRLAGYAEVVFPGSGFRLNDRFMVEALERNGGREAFEQLSDGTREQIGVLVRLAMAQCIADTQGALPVIFDDALVYSDDARLERLFAVLEQAGRRHQVVVLTCHERSFVPLAERFGGAALRLSEW